jgi:hypothetical protein
MVPWNILRGLTFQPHFDHANISRAFNGDGARRIRAPPAKESVEKESDMLRFGILLATVLGAALAATAPASAAEVSCWYNGAMHTCVWYPGYAYAYPQGYGQGYGIGSGLAALATAPLRLAEGVTSPLVTGRSVAVSGAGVPAMAGAGNYCATPVKTCLLTEPGWLGTGCSCRVYGGHARGFVQ